jgi:hypothetical protein
MGTGGKPPGHEAHRLFPSSAEVTNAWSYTSLSPHTSLWRDTRATVPYLTALDMPLLRRLVTDFPLRQRRFDARSNYVGFVADEVGLGQVF